jgi:hypothetical protein
VGAVELEAEVTAWLDGLADDEIDYIERYSTCWPVSAALLGEPFARQLDGKPRELRFAVPSHGPPIEKCLGDDGVRSVRVDWRGCRERCPQQQSRT